MSGPNLPGIVVVARVTAKRGREAELVEVAQAVCRGSRLDPGCLGYRFYADTEQAGRYVFVEEWADDDALQAHFVQPHTRAFMAQIYDLVDGPADALFHTVASARRLGRGGLEPATP